ncbi:MAG: phage major capsid protein [Microcoleus sp.]
MIEPITRQRTIQIEKLGNVDADTYEISFSSEYPARFGEIYEVLRHDEGCCDLSRLRGGTLPLLYAHDKQQLIGRALGGQIDSISKKGRAKIRFGNDEKSQERKRQFDDDILINVSVGYSVHEWSQDGDYVYVSKWEPYEISLLPSPADPTVGKYRAYQSNVEPEENKTESTAMTETSPIPAAPAPAVDEKEIRQTEQLRVREIMSLGAKWEDRYGERSTQMANSLIDAGIGLVEARSKFLDLVSEPETTNPLAKMEPGNHRGIDMTPKEEESYSLIRAIQAHATGNYKAAGFEREVSEELAKLSGKPESGSLFVPLANLKIRNGQRTIYQTSVPAAAGNLISTDLDTTNFIDMYRNNSVFLNLGVRTLGGLQGNVNIPKRLTGSSVSWVAENAGPPDSNGTFGLVNLAPKGLAVMSSITRIMTIQSSMDMENLIREDMALSIATEIDRVICHGSGAAGQPRGILNTAGIGSVSLGVNGGPITWDSLVDLETALTLQNALVGNPAYVTNAKQIGVLQKIKDTTGQPLWNGNTTGLMPGMPGRIKGYPITYTNNVSSSLTKGTGTNLSALLFGNFRDVFMGTWGPALEIDINPYGTPEFAAGSLLLRGLIYMDLAIARAQSFAAITDAT